MNVSRFAALVTGALLICVPSVISAAPTPFSIPVIVSQTGQASFVGKDEAVAFGVIEKYVNAHGGVRGTPIHFDLHDDTSDPKVSVQLLNQILPSHPAIVLGSTLTATCGAIAAITENTGPVTWCFSPGLQPAAGSYAFASSASLKNLQRASWGYMRLKGYRRIALVSGNDASGIANQKISHEVVAEAANRGMELVADETLASDSTSAGAQAARIKAAHADAIICWVTGAAFGTLLRSLNDAGVDIPIVTTGANSNETQMKQYAAFLPTELILPGFPYNLGEEALRKTELASATGPFFQAFRDAGATPSPAASPYVWDLAQIVLSAYQKLGFNATPLQMRDYIEGIRHFVGINGFYDFSSGDQHGLSSANTVFTHWNPKTNSFDPISGLGGKPK